jgi:hypothetical protein
MAQLTENKQRRPSLIANFHGFSKVTVHEGTASLPLPEASTLCGRNKVEGRQICQGNLQGRLP